MEIYVKKFFYFNISLYFWLSIIDFIIYIGLPISQQLMTSQIRSRIEYLIPTYNVLVLILYSNLMQKSSLTDGLVFNTN